MAEYFVNDYRAAEQTLRLPDLHQALYDADTVFLPKTVVCLHGEAHARKKRVFAGVFNRRFFRHYQNHVFPALSRKASTRSWQRARRHGKVRLPRLDQPHRRQRGH